MLTYVNKYIFNYYTHTHIKESQQNTRVLKHRFFSILSKACNLNNSAVIQIGTQYKYCSVIPLIQLCIIRVCLVIVLIQHPALLSLLFHRSTFLQFISPPLSLSLSLSLSLLFFHLSPIPLVSFAFSLESSPRVPFREQRKLLATF